MWIMGRIHIQIGLPRGPLSIPSNSAIQYVLPKGASCFSLFSMLHLYLHRLCWTQPGYHFPHSCLLDDGSSLERIIVAELKNSKCTLVCYNFHYLIYLWVHSIRELFGLPLHVKNRYFSLSGVYNKIATGWLLLWSWCFLLTQFAAPDFLCFCGHLAEVVADVHAVHALLIRDKEASILKLFAELQMVSALLLIIYIWFHKSDQ